MDIRQLGLGDVDIFKRIRLEALRTDPEAYASTVADWEALPEEEWQRRLTSSSVFVALRQDDPIAVMGLIRQASSKMAHRATIVMVYVRASERGSGLAALLLNALLGHARQIGILQAELAVSALNLTARHFYQREGFEEIGIVPAGFIHNGHEIDEVLMMRRLDRTS